MTYKEVPGSIYVLPCNKFTPGKTSWNEEWVCVEMVEPIKEIQIPNVRKYLLDLERESKLLIVRYPQKLPHIPEDDEDIVVKAAQWVIDIGDFVIDQVKEFQPQLLERVMKRVDELKSKNNSKH